MLLLHQAIDFNFVENPSLRKILNFGNNDIPIFSFSVDIVQLNKKPLAEVIWSLLYQHFYSTKLFPSSLFFEIPFIITLGSIKDMGKPLTDFSNSTFIADIMLPFLTFTKDWKELRVFADRECILLQIYFIFLELRQAITKGESILLWLIQYNQVII